MLLPAFVSSLSATSSDFPLGLDAYFPPTKRRCLGVGGVVAIRSRGRARSEISLYVASPEVSCFEVPN